VAGDYVRVRQSLVDLIIENQEAGEVIEVSQGDDFTFTPFKTLRISHSSNAEQVIKLIVSTGKKAGSSQVGGSISIVGDIALDAATLAALENINATITVNEPVRGPGSNTQKTVTNASASLLAQNLARKYLLIQNKDASGDIYINFGAAATVANGLKIAPNGAYELNANMLTAEIFAIGNIANNPNIVVIEA
jgi:hypothetical protein